MARTQTTNRKVRSTRMMPADRVRIGDYVFPNAAEWAPADNPASYVTSVKLVTMGGKDAVEITTEAFVRTCRLDTDVRIAQL